jgi:2-dehydro-3-deoxyphosphogluconate aldolase / (4S)-4-hydroxy-2-oxoglutarate aldolase
MPAPVDRSLLELSPVIPVVIVDDARQAVPLARALLAGGLRLVETTMRTPAALEAISMISAEVPEIIVGAGTVTQPRQARAAREAGAQFLVSPGSTPELLAAMADTGLPHLPGVGTVSEVLAMLERGYTEMKFFPAHAVGGAAFLQSLVPVLPTARFCPTGGVTPTSARDYLALPNVASVGGSWITPPDALRAGDWGRVQVLADAASHLRPAAG